MNLTRYKNLSHLSQNCSFGYIILPAKTIKVEET